MGGPTTTTVPAKADWRGEVAHKDSFEDGGMAEGKVGLLYLEGDGQ